MESLCTVCNETNTKYTCIICEVFVCNKCVKATGENVDGYNEELKRVGKCPDCDTDFTKTVPHWVITESVQAMQPPETKKLQKSVYNMFGKSAQNKLKELLPKKSEESLPSLPKTKINPKQHKAPSTVSRTVTPATVDKWKAELASHSISEWLKYDIDKDRKVKDMKCKFCITYENNIKNLSNFTNIFIIGSTNYKKSAVEDHATKSKHHLKAYNLYLKSKGVSVDMSKALPSAVPKNTDIMSGIAQMDQKDLERTRKKFEVAYFIAKHQLPIVTYTDFLKLEQKHGVDIKDAYQNRVSGGTFIEYIGDDLKRNLYADLAKAKFFSILCNSSMDSAVIENEVIYALHFDPMPSNSDSVEVKISFLHMYQLKHQDADGVLDAISVNVKESILKGFKSIGIEGIDASKKMIGFTSDGASVN